MDLKDTKYILSPELQEAITIADITQRPLLIKGEPGTGKTLLAKHIAQNMGLELFQWHIKSTTLAKDGLYFYDAVTRLNDARFSDGDVKKVQKIENYIRLEPMGQAFNLAQRCVLLIDEIDKADIEFPNDLLQELDRMEFSINETGQTIKAAVRPFVVITSNNEKELPDAFLRRCIFHFIRFPNSEMMTEIVNAHFPNISSQLLAQTLDVFYKIRNVDELQKKPSTSELIDWLQVLLHHGGTFPKDTEIPFLGTLIKNEKDLKRFR